MFRPLTMVIFRFRLKNLVSSYTRLMWPVYSGDVRGEVPTSPFTSPLYTAHISRADGHCQGTKHVVDLYVVNSIYRVFHDFRT